MDNNNPIHDRFTATDVVALVLILGYIFLVYLGKGTELSPAILLLVGYYFGKKNQLMTNNLS